jgi:hypothetical protein
MSWSLTFAWQDSLDVGSKPHALSNISSSSSSDSSSDEKPFLDHNMTGSAGTYLVTSMLNINMIF